MFDPSKILFEYGGIQPLEVFDKVVHGTKSYVKIVDSPVRTETHALALYQPSPPKTDRNRRAIIGKYQTDFPVKHKAFYLSWWVYFPDESPWNAEDVSWLSLGKPSIWFGPPGNRHKWHINMPSFRVHKRSRQIETDLVWHKCFGTQRKSWRWRSGFFVNKHLKEWIHLQSYLKVTGGSDSVIRAWVNNMMFMEKTTWNDMVGNIRFKGLDPESYAEWDENDCKYHSPNQDGFPRISIELYSGKDSEEKRIFVDDIVWAVAKVPEDYGVGGVAPPPPPPPPPPPDEIPEDVMEAAIKVMKYLKE